MPSSRIVMFVYGDVTHDSRVLREAGSLAAEGHRVSILARPRDLQAEAGDREAREGFEIVRIPLPGGWRRPWRVLGWPLRSMAHLVDRLRGRPGVEQTLAWLVIWWFAIRGWGREAARLAEPADFYHAHDLTGLPAALAAQRRHGGHVVYDSHEIYLESGANVRLPAWLRDRLARMEQAWIRETVALVTVNEACGAELNRRYQVPGPTVIVHNCPPRWETPAEQDGRLREATGCPAGTPIALYHGSFSSYRGLDKLADALLAPGLERAHAAYLGYGSQRGLLESLATDGRYDGRLHILEPVPPEDVVGWVSGADVEVMLLEPGTLNHVVSTPNKVFEALAAGVPVVTSDFPGLRAILIGDPDGPLGAVCDPADPAAIAAALRSILELDEDARADLRRRCLRAAHARWNWETESAKLVDLYASLEAGAA